MTRATHEVCANCGKIIGSLETPHVWRENIVCAQCHKNLMDESSAVSTVIPVVASAPPQAAPPLGPDDIICPNPNCAYRGRGLKKQKGSPVVTILLLLFGILPGLIYAIIYNGRNVVCPRCGLKVRDE